MAAQSRVPASLDIPGLKTAVADRAKAKSDLAAEYKLVQNRAISKGFRLEPSNVEDAHAPDLVQRADEVAEDLEDLGSKIQSDCDHVEDLEAQYIANGKRVEDAVKANEGRLPVQTISNRLTDGQRTVLFNTAVRLPGFEEYWKQNGGRTAVSDALRNQLEAAVAEKDVFETQTNKSFNVCAQLVKAADEIGPLRVDLQNAKNSRAAAATKVTSLENDVAVLKGKLVVRNGQIDSLTDEVTKARNEAYQSQLLLQTAQTNGQVQVKRINDLKGDLQTAQVEVTNLTGQVTEAEGRVAALEDQVFQAQARTDDLEQTLTSARDDHTQAHITAAVNLRFSKAECTRLETNLQNTMSDCNNHAQRADSLAQELAALTSSRDQQVQQLQTMLDEANKRADTARELSAESTCKMQSAMDEDYKKHTLQLETAQLAHHGEVSNHEQTKGSLQETMDKCKSLENDLELKQEELRKQTGAKDQVDQSLTKLQEEIADAGRENDNAKQALEQKHQQLTREIEAKANVTQSLDALQRKLEQERQSWQDERTEQTKTKAEVDQSLAKLQTEFDDEKRKHAQTTQTLEKKQKQLTDVTNAKAEVDWSLAELQTELEKVKREHADATQTLSEKQEQLTDVTSAKAEVDHSLASLRTEFDDAKRKHAEAIQSLDQKQQELQQQLTGETNAKAEVDRSLAKLQEELDEAKHESAEATQALQQQLTEKTDAKTEVDRSLADVQNKLEAAKTKATQDLALLRHQLAEQAQDKNQALERIKSLEEEAQTEAETARITLQTAKASTAKLKGVVKMACRSMYEEHGQEDLVLGFFREMEATPSVRAIRDVPPWTFLFWPRADGAQPPQTVLPQSQDDASVELQYQTFMFRAGAKWDESSLIHALATVDTAPAQFLADMVGGEAYAILSTSLADGFLKAKLLALFHILYILKERFAVQTAHFEQMRTALHHPGHAVATMANVLEEIPVVGADGTDGGITMLCDGRYLVLDRLGVDIEWVLVMDVPYRIIRAVHRSREIWRIGCRICEEVAGVEGIEGGPWIFGAVSMFLS